MKLVTAVDFAQVGDTLYNCNMFVYVSEPENRELEGFFFFNLLQWLVLFLTHIYKTND